MSQQRRGGLGRGLAALIPTGPDEGPRLGDDAADVILGPRGGAPRTTPPRSRSARSPGSAARDSVSGELGAAGASGAESADGKQAPGSAGQSADVSRETDELVDPGAIYREIPPSDIDPNPKQPRTSFDEEALAELAHSVKEFGLLQPIVVREMPDGRYQLIMGERRWRASQRAGLDAVPAIVRQTDDQDLLRDALLENIHRVQLNPLEEAAAYQQLLEEFDVTQAELAARIGRSRPAITNSIRLLQLPTAVQRRVAAGVLSAGHARALLGLDAGAPAQDDLAARIVAEGLSVRATEEIVTLANRDAGDSTPKPPPAPKGRQRNPELEVVAGRLSDRFETSVSVTMGRRKGRITIDVGDSEDLQRVLDLLEGGSTGTSR
ncbi:ParB/RepB/Spo0J family partition protein [Rhodococcus sp. IEGM 1408]|uniref:ParB/RepB/Spo0J family partition protein n=1 Tax=Rhodococcus sp. IEGM 1408 TaxID=3082220 RepID=UPI0029545FBC|nr:ParB/RepB/Spo0J family partition protein [Rhodococcus sp. IEGM 1408]MDV8000095.1 ParB/RepB/Spo0J family partition protein [Rhodococcus sp. IEGM 1408]